MLTNTWVYVHFALNDLPQDVQFIIFLFVYCCCFLGLALISASHYGIPTVQTLSSRDLTAQIGSDMRGLAQRTFKKAVARLAFDRPVMGIAPIHAFERLMEKDAWDDGAFFEILSKKMAHMLQCKNIKIHNFFFLIINKIKCPNKEQKKKNEMIKR